MAGQTGFRLLLDSDMLFWRIPQDLLNHFASLTAFHMRDMVDDGYTMPAEQLSVVLGAPIAKGVNSELIGLDASQIDWPLLERGCAVLQKHSGDKRLIEQTLWAVALGAQSSTALNTSTYRLLVYPRALERENPEAATLLHYACQSRLAYHATEWRRYLASLN